MVPQKDWPDGTEAMTAMQALLNYTAGAMIYVRREYSDRINILRSSWIAAPCMYYTSNPSLALYSWAGAGGLQLFGVFL